MVVGGVVDLDGHGRIMKEVVMIGPYSKLEMDFLADHPGNIVFHNHPQLHMYFGWCFSYKHGLAIPLWQKGKIVYDAPLVFYSLRSYCFGVGNYHWCVGSCSQSFLSKPWLG